MFGTGNAVADGALAVAGGLSLVWCVWLLVREVVG